MDNDVSIKKLILVPSLVTLAITLLRLTGELMHWSPRLFNREAGGGGALVGIAWLVPVFGIYFAIKLARAGQGPGSAGKAIGLAVLGFAVVPIGGFLATRAGLAPQSIAIFAVFIVLAVVGAAIAFYAWPALGRVLLAYGLAARIPVVVVMLIAMLASWGTHYDVAPPGFPEMGTLQKWFMIGVVPQLTIWIWFTIAAGAVCGAIAGAITGRQRASAPAY
jgi:hypothetical protein